MQKVLNGFIQFSRGWLVVSLKGGFDATGRHGGKGELLAFCSPIEWGSHWPGEVRTDE